MHSAAWGGDAATGAVPARVVGSDESAAKRAWRARPVHGEASAGDNAVVAESMVEGVDVRSRAVAVATGTRATDR